jgi:hypothetical protein
MRAQLNAKSVNRSKVFLSQKTFIALRGKAEIMCCVLFCVVLFCFVLFCVVLCCVVLCCVVLCCVVLCCVVLCCVVLCCVVLCCVVVWCVACAKILLRDGIFSIMRQKVTPTIITTNRK